MYLRLWLVISLVLLLPLFIIFNLLFLTLSHIAASASFVIQSTFNIGSQGGNPLIIVDGTLAGMLLVVDEC